MNLFQDIRSEFGTDCVKKVRDYEKTTIKLARHRNHLRFNLRCKDLAITPTSLKLKTNIKTKRAADIIKRAEKALLRERIGLTHHKTKVLLKKKDEFECSLRETLPNNVLEATLAMAESSYETAFEKSKMAQIKKLDKLQHRKNDNESVNLSGDQLKRLVINLSKYKVKDHETKLLARGLGFAVSPDKLPVNDIVIGTELCCKNLKTEEADQCRAEVVGVIKSSKPPKSNISKEERGAIKELKANKDITILPADKGKAVVIMDTANYKEKCLNTLSDTNTYCAIDKDPSQSTKRKLISKLLALKKDGKLDDYTYDVVYPTAEVTPRFYALPKIHKTGAPLRPIVSSIGAVTYPIAKLLAKIIQPVVGKNGHHIQNVKDFADKVSDITLSEEETMISFDVTALFTSVPVMEVVEIVKTMLDRDTKLSERTGLKPEDIADLLSFILNATFFVFGDQVYKQQYGAAMGSPISPIVANLFMEKLETDALATCAYPPRIWYRYVDDTFVVIHKDHVQGLKDHMNTYHPSIKFTSEEPVDNSLAFLDARVYLDNTRRLRLDVYRKHHTH
jgi:hypothetical protein